MVGENQIQKEAGTTAEIYKLPDLGLADDFDVETAAKYLFGECAHHLAENFARHRDDKNEAVLMQIRIGMRRTRVAMKVFKPIIEPKKYKKFKQEFRYFGRLLGDARDLDVFLRGMLSEKCPISGLEAAYEELRLQTQRLRDREYDRNAQEVDGGRLEALLQSFEGWRQSDWSAHLTAANVEFLKSPIAPFAVQRIDQGRGKLLKRGTSIDQVSTDDLHEVRKYVKRCRYHLRFFSSLFDPAKVRQGYELLAQMQDSLGYVNDVREGLKVMSVLGGEVQADHISDTLRLMGAIVAKAGDEVENHLGDFAGLWRQYEGYRISDADLR